MKLTPEEKYAKQQRTNLKLFHNRIESAFNFKEITSWEDLGKWTPLHNGKSGVLSFKELKNFLGEQKQQLEDKLSQGKKHEIPGPELPKKEVVTDGTVELVSSTAVLPTLEAKKTEQEENKESVPSGGHLEVAPHDPDYGWKRSPNVHPDYFAFWFQKKAEAEIEHKLVVEKRRAILLIATTGTGKTFMSADVIRHLMDIDFTEGKTWSHVPYLNVTRSTVVEQTSRVFNKFFNITVENCDVINIEQLRSKYGRLFLYEKSEVRNGKEETWWEWKKKISPAVIVWDECQALKNAGSTQHEIAAAYNNLPMDTRQVFVSATPFTRVIEARCFAVATGKDISHLGFPPGTKLTNETWPAYAAAIAHPSKPHEYSESAVDRLMEDLKDYVVRVKGVRPQFDAVNSTEKINFQTTAESDYYHSAWDRYIKELAKIEARQMAEGTGGKGAGTNQLVAFLKFRMAAEYCRRYVLAKRMYESVSKGNAAVCAVNFKSTIIAITQILINDYGVTRDQISLVWGGGQGTLTKAQKEKNKVKKEYQEKKATFDAMGMSLEELLESVGLDDIEDKIVEEFDPRLRLGPQSKEDRQIEIDKFQSGKSLYCMFTFRAGGVGLSLHHSDELTTDWNRNVAGFQDWYLTIEEWNKKHPDHPCRPGKVRRKESGYAFEEDIKFIPVRPRECFLAPTYSAIELVQGLGRCPRLTSLSHTKQTLLFYRGTIEDDVCAIVTKKLKCLSRVVKMKESWEDVVVNRSQSSALTQRHIESVPEEDSVESVTMIDTSEDNDE